jgi:hypothetical protein
MQEKQESTRNEGFLHTIFICSSAGSLENAVKLAAAAVIWEEGTLSISITAVIEFERNQHKGFIQSRIRELRLIKRERQASEREIPPIFTASTDSFIIACTPINDVWPGLARNMNKPRPAAFATTASRQRLNAKAPAHWPPNSEIQPSKITKLFDPAILHHVCPIEQQFRSEMASQKPSFNLLTCARPNILALEPYRCARE